MRYGLATYRVGGETLPALVFGGRLVDVARASASIDQDSVRNPFQGRGLDQIFDHWGDVNEEMNAFAADVAGQVDQGTVEFLTDDVELMYSITTQRKY